MERDLRLKERCASCDFGLGSLLCLLESSDLIGEALSFCLLSSLCIGRFLSGDFETCLDCRLLSGDLRLRESLCWTISGDFLRLERSRLGDMERCGRSAPLFLLERESCLLRVGSSRMGLARVFRKLLLLSDSRRVLLDGSSRDRFDLLDERDRFLFGVSLLREVVLFFFCGIS